MPPTATARSMIPGPPLDPVYGFLGNHAHFLRDPVSYLTRVYRDYGRIAALARGAPSILFAFGPDYNRLLLTHTDVFHSTGLTVPGPFSTAQRRVGYGIFSMNAAGHRRRRRLIMPPLHKKAVESYGRRMIDIVGRFLDRWDGQHQVDMLEQMRRLSLTLSSIILFGLDIEPHRSPIGDTIERWLRMNSSVAVRLSPKERPSAAYRRMIRFAQRVEDQILQLIQQKRATANPGNDVLSLLVQASDEGRDGMSHPELLGQVSLLLAASYETTAASLNWVLFLLAQHPGVAVDLIDELQGVLRGGTPDPEYLHKLPLLDRVVKESMRLLPTVAYNSRTNITPIQMGPHLLPKGTTVIFSHYITHRMRDLYSSPYRFKPERWESARPSPYAYLPFGAGPRMCIGAMFAMQAIKITLSMILQRYRFNVVPGSRIDRFVRITLTCRCGMPMQIVPQDRGFHRTAFRGNLHEMIEWD